MLFQKNSVKFLGWYHSHPRIAPFPSQKDINMQHEIQTHVSYAIGIICSSYMDEKREQLLQASQETSYVNYFKVQQEEQELVAVKVPVVIHHTPIEFSNYSIFNHNSVTVDEMNFLPSCLAPPHLKNELVQTVKNVLFETSQQFVLQGTLRIRCC